MPRDQKTTYTLDKYKWTSADFDQMCWHDNPIHAIKWTEECYPNDLLFDIDYIFAWVDPEKPGEAYSFWIAPCTLVFHAVVDLNINYPSRSIDSLPTIINVSRQAIIGEQQEGEQSFRWMFELVEGEITLHSTGFTQYVRNKPIHVNSQVLTEKQRGRISFSTAGPPGFFKSLIRRLLH